ncbi:MAG: site-specific integrase [Terriglobia bacterium]|jgi:integrase
MLRRARHQRGSLKRVRRKSGETVWVFRWYETEIDGSKKYRKVVVGSAEEFKTEASAEQAVDALRLTINQQTPRQQLQPIGFGTLVQHYREHEMPDVFNKRQPGKIRVEAEGRKSYATQATYEGYLKKWILPRWRSYGIADVKAVQVEEWLRSLPLAAGSKAKIRNIMSALYSHAIRWEWVRHNPITSVRQSAKRSKVPTVLSIEQIQALLEHLEEPCRTMVLLDAATGLRVGELLGLKWADVDFEKLEINVTRSVVKQRIGPCKTEASQKPIPLDAELGEQVLNWRLKSPYNRPEDWVFASPHKRGKQPYWPGSLFRVHVQPALRAAEISGKVGWHTLRHSFGTLMKANGEDIKTIQELLRHANYRVTADVYTQAMTTTKREAQAKVVRMILPGKSVQKVG